MFSAPSIFQSLPDQKNKRLWTNKAEGLSSNLQITFSFKALKRSSKSPEKLSERYFFLVGHHLCYSKRPDRSNFSGFMNLKWVTVQLSKLVEIDQSRHFQGVRFIRDKKFSTIFLESEEEFQIFKREIAKYCIFKDFYKEFKPLNIIDSGSFGNVKI